VQNRDSFLANIARQLGREVRYTPQALPANAHSHALTRLTELDIQARCDAFVEFASKVMLVDCQLTSEEHAAQAALHLCDKYGHQPVIISGDSRLADLGITALLQQQCQASLWDPTAGEENIRLAEQAKVGVVYAEHGLTESGGVVLFSAPDRGRAVSLLPESSIFVLRKSSLLPRVAQLAQRLHHMALQGERMPSCINLISGPSSTADIELIKVIGVHGPINAAYLIIEDC
jgi:L-lactate dehydrogenase complex protein LldG